jgi:hypothetical protein
MDYRHDPDMMLPLGKVWDHIGMFVCLCFMILIVWHMIMYIWMLILPLVFVFVDVGPRGREAEMVGESARQGPT